MNLSVGYRSITQTEKIINVFSYDTGQLWIICDTINRLSFLFIDMAYFLNELLFVALNSKTILTTAICALTKFTAHGPKSRNLPRRSKARNRCT